MGQSYPNLLLLDICVGTIFISLSVQKLRPKWARCPDCDPSAPMELVLHARPLRCEAPSRVRRGLSAQLQIRRMKETEIRCASIFQRTHFRMITPL
jgi:hypothetical protein